MYELSFAMSTPSSEYPTPATGHETMVADPRDEQRPSEFVQNKFINALPDAPIPVSCLHTHRRCSR